MKPLRYIWIGLAIFVFLFLLSYFILKIPRVQNYVAVKITNILSDRLDTKVQIKEVDINIFKGFKLDELYIEDVSGDTLIYVESFYSDFQNSLRSFYHKNFLVQGVQLENGKIFINRPFDDPVYNFKRLLNRDFDPFYIDTVSSKSAAAKIIQSVNQRRKSKSFDFSISSLNMKNIDFLNKDDVSGNQQSAHIDNLSATFDTFDIKTLNFTINNLDFSGIDFNHKNYEPDSLIIFPESIQENTEFKFRINNLEGDNLNGIALNTKNENTSYQKDIFNPSNIHFENIKINAKDIIIIDPYYVEGELNKMTGNIGDFTITQFEASKFYLQKRKSGFDGLKFKTPNSSLSKSVSFNYRNISDWKDFVNKVIISGEMINTKVAIKDLKFFSPQLKENRFFIENATESIILNGKFTGRVNSFNARNIKAELTNNLKFEGSIIARDITVPDETLLNIGINTLDTDVNTLNKLIPGFNVPDNFYKLNKLNFTGRFDGYYQDFVAYGDLNTDLGRADVDMRLNLKSGSSNAKYSGKINLYDFDLKSWSGVEKFDKVSFSANVENGSGLELNTAYAELGGELISFDYNGYNYNGIIDAKLEQNLFDGKFSSSDKDVDFDFEGSIDFTGDIPIYDFDADIRSLNLKTLNFSKDIDHIEGIVDIKAKGSSIDDLVGSALGNKILIERNNDTLDFGHLALASTLKNTNDRSLFIDSDIGNVEITGQYKLTELPDAVIDMLKKNYPDFTSNINYISGVPKENVKAHFMANVKDAGEIFTFFTAQNVTLDSLNASGDIDFNSSLFEIDIKTPYIKYDQYSLQDLDLTFNLGESQGKFMLNSNQSLISNSEINNLKASGTITNDSIHFDITATKALDSISNVNIAGEIFPADIEVEVQFSELEFNLIGTDWLLSKNNSVVLGDEKLKLSNFILIGDERRIGIKSINKNKGIEAEISDVQLSLINEFIANENVKLSGNTNAIISFENIFKNEGLYVKADVKEVYFNEQSMGDMFINASTDFSSRKINYTATLDNIEDKVSLRGNYGLDSKLVNAQADVDGFPLVFLENFLEGSIENTQGRIFAQIDIDGKINDLDTRGRGEIRDGFTKVNYLGTKYSFENALFKVSKNYVDFSGGKLIDSRSQVAIITGGLTRENFQNLGLNLTIDSDKFILLNTTSIDNESYYGFGQGKANVNFSGKFSEMIISIVAKTAEETTMTLPLSYVNSARDESFLPISTREEFIASIESEIDSEKSERYNVGLTLKMSLDVTPEAEMKVLFEPVTGHQLIGKGSGPIQLNLSPNGDIDMFGKYNIESGKYDFALENFIKKEFTIEKGGYIEWSGDPINAKIDISAKYKTIRAPLDVFLAEYLAENSDLQTSATQETDVLLTVNLLDQLLNPTIKFEIDFPNLSGDLSALVNNKLLILQDDPLNLNNQVLGLLIFNNFLPYNNPIATFSNSTVNSSVGVIVGELLSAQLSSYVSTLMENVLNENGLIYDIDVDVRLENANALTSTALNYGLTLKPKFNNDKFDVVLGGDYLTEDESGQSAYYTGDFIVDYYLQKDKKIKIRIYGRTDREVLEGRRQRVGAGIYFRKEFSSFKELRNSMKIFAKDLNEQ